MTVTSTQARVDYVGSGSAGPFSFPFRIFAASDLVLTQRNDTTGVETPLFYPSQYSVTGVGDAFGGTVTLFTALPSGSSLSIRRVRPTTQQARLRGQGRFYPETYEDGLDHGIMVSQQLEEAIGRSLQVPASEPSVGILPSIASRANKFMAFDGAGQPLATQVSIGTAGNVAVSTFWSSVLTATTQSLAQAALGLSQFFLGPYYPTQAGESGVTNNTYPVCHFHRYGAWGDGTHDDVVAIEACAAFAPAGSTLTGIGGATYLVSRTPNLGNKRLTMAGQMATLKASAAMNVVAKTTDVSGMLWRDWYIDGNGVAKSGIQSIAATMRPEGVKFLNVHVKNLATDHSLAEAGIHVKSSNIAYRHLDVTIDNCSCKDSGTSGAYVYYSDDIKFTNWTGERLDNHSAELNFVKDFVAMGITSSYCGGSAMAVGAQSYHGVVSGVTGNYCSGDGVITVENTSADVRVSNFELRNCWKAGLSANYGDAGIPYPNDIMRGIKFSNGSARAAAPVAITGATKSNPAKLTAVGHGIKTIYLSNTTQISISGVVGMTQLNGLTPHITTIDPATGLHDPDHIWLTGVDSSAFSTYTSGGTFAPFCNGANIYGGVPAVATNIGLHDLEFLDFNCGLGMLYMDSSECRDIRVAGLQGPLSAVARFTFFTHGAIDGIRNTDQNHQPSDPLGAIQFLNQTGTANGCDHVVITDVDVLQCGPTSNYPLFYIEGSGDFTINNPTTGGASCIVKTRAAADSPIIRVRNLSVSLSTPAVYSTGAGSTPTWYIDYPKLPRTITASGTGVYYDGTVRVDATSGNKTFTLPLGASMVGKRIAIVKADASANTVTPAATGGDALTAVALAAIDKAIEYEAYAGGWNAVAAR